jgi:hypothetical protein
MSPKTQGGEKFGKWFKPLNSRDITSSHLYSRDIVYLSQCNIKKCVKKKITFHHFFKI